MHGRVRLDRKRRSQRHMCSVPSPTTTSSVAAAVGSLNSFFKDGRKISVGDCALFKPPQESPPFIGIICWLTERGENNLNLGINWLYRPADVKLGKGILAEVAPNEVFYSFHKDVIPAASLLHPCKVTFLPKGVELPSGLASFVCRRVYDIANKSLWWLTDQDYIDERQEEVNQLLYKTFVEMHANVHSDGHSPKPGNGPSSTSQLKPGLDSTQNSPSSFTSQVKGKKRERGDLGCGPVKRERSTKTNDADSDDFSPESNLKFEISKISEKGGLTDFEAVERLVRVMLPEKADRKIDLAGRSMLAGVIAATDKFDCLSRFVQLRGLPVLDEWLQDVHKGKIGGEKDSDKSVEEFLFALLRALDKLPVNLHALQMCNIGKSVNHLRTHKNFEIQRKARSLVDIWKKRVEAEMNSNDVKPGSNQAVFLPGRPHLPEVAMKSSVTQISISKTSSAKPAEVETVAKSTSPSSGFTKSAPSHSSMGTNVKDNSTDLPQTPARDEKSSSSSQSHNSQSCSSDLMKTVGSSGKDDARSSTAGSISVNKISRGTSRNRKSISGFMGGPAAVPGAKRERGSSKSSSFHRNTTLENLSHSGGCANENPHDVHVADVSSHSKLILKIPSRGRSPAQTASGGSIVDPSITSGRATSPVLPEKHDQFDHNLKEKNGGFRANDLKDVADGSPADDDIHNEGQCRTGEFTRKVAEGSKAVPSSSGNEKRHEASFNSPMDALMDCTKYSEANVPLSVGVDDVGMNLLASVAAGEVSKSDLASPAGSPQCSHVIESKSSHVNNVSQDRKESNDHMDKNGEKQNVVTDTVQTEEEIRSGQRKEVPSSNKDTQVVPCMKTSPKLDEMNSEAAMVVSSVSKKEKVTYNSEGGLLHEAKAVVGGVNSVKVCSSLLTESNLNNNISEEGGGKELKPQGLKETDGMLSFKYIKQLESGNVTDTPFKKTSEIDTKTHVKETNNPKTEHENNARLGDEIVANCKSECTENNIEEKEQKVLPLLSDQKIQPRVSDTEAKLEFDLNEGFNADEGKYGHLMSPLYSFPVSSASTNLPASVTVAAAARGSFVPPEDLLRSNNGEQPGWKGSAATSAFRPAEPRKILDMPLNTINIPATKHSRPLLDIDLNVPDERMLEDVASQNSTSDSGFVSIPVNKYNNNVARNVPFRYSGGLDLDLNRTDESNNLLFDIPFLPPVDSSSSRGFSNGEPSNRRNFDLNNGPLLDEVSVEPVASLNHQHMWSSKPLSQPQHVATNLRMINAGIGGFSAWFPPGNTYSTISIPSVLPDRGDQQSFTVASAGGSQRVIASGPAGGNPYVPEGYRGGPVLSSSPAIPGSFSPAAPFQYPVFPFGTSFVPPSMASIPGGPGPTTYMDSSSSGRLYSQLLGGPGAVASYPRSPYLVSIPDANNNGGVESSRKWGRQGLDLNAGPGCPEIEGRDETLPLASRQALAEEQARMYQMTGGAVKRKEPEGGFNMERYKHQSSWQ